MSDAPAACPALIRSVHSWFHAGLVELIFWLPWRGVYCSWSKYTLQFLLNRWLFMQSTEWGISPAWTRQALNFKGCLQLNSLPSETRVFTRSCTCVMGKRDCDAIWEYEWESVWEDGWASVWAWEWASVQPCKCRSVQEWEQASVGEWKQTTKQTCKQISERNSKQMSKQVNEQANKWAGEQASKQTSKWWSKQASKLWISLTLSGRRHQFGSWSQHWIRFVSGHWFGSGSWYWFGDGSGHHFCHGSWCQFGSLSGHQFGSVIRG